MNPKELKQSRIQLFRDAANFKKTKRIPHFANVVTWKVFDAGYTLDRAMTNFDVLEERVVKFLDRYPVDGLMDVGINDHAHCTVDTLMQDLDDPTRHSGLCLPPRRTPPVCCIED